MITVIANGKAKELPSELSVRRFLELSSVNSLIAVVELRGEIVPRQEYETAIIRDGDRIEVVRMMGGG